MGKGERGRRTEETGRGCVCVRVCPCVCAMCAPVRLFARAAPTVEWGRGRGGGGEGEGGRNTVPSCSDGGEGRWVCVRVCVFLLLLSCCERRACEGCVSASVPVALCCCSLCSLSRPAVPLLGRRRLLSWRWAAPRAPNKDTNRERELTNTTRKQQATGERTHTSHTAQHRQRAQPRTHRDPPPSPACCRLCVCWLGWLGPEGARSRRKERSQPVPTVPPRHKTSRDKSSKDKLSKRIKHTMRTRGERRRREAEAESGAGGG
jgi:hypothetical protein